MIPTCRPQYLTLATRRCLVTEWCPPALAPRATLLVAQAFGDEANLCRRMIRLLAEALYSLRVRTVVLDCSGTGDSEGDFCDASPSQWLREFGALQAMQCAGQPVLLLGVRFGAWLAMALQARSRGVLLWAPVLSGAELLRERARRDAFRDQVLRVPRAEVAMQNEGRRPQDPARQHRRHGNPTEPGPQLFAELAACVVSPPAADEPVTMFDVRLAPANAAATVLSSGRRLREVADDWRRAGKRVEALGVSGHAFWQVADPVDCTALVDVSIDRVRSWL